MTSQPTRRFQPIDPARDYRGTCEGLPSLYGFTPELCDGTSSRDILRGRSARWIGPADRRLCGSCKREWERRVAKAAAQ